MRIANLLPLAFSLLFASLIAAEDKAPQPVEKELAKASKESYVKVLVEVEIRGILKADEKGVVILCKSRTYNLFHPNEDISDSPDLGPFALDFSRAKDLRELAKVLAGKEVIVTGKSEMRCYRQKIALTPGGTGGSGFGAAGPFMMPAPHWILQPTLRVTSIETAGK